ncbi:AraC family transcriptional regulator [Flavisphingomonas formosensis]|uniref:AraC family transcriptional regulator n=1 Tax=Flavisphingomonas formosensis TaxID=861534 RepID=UPI0012F77DDB|nr:AraC family transcriptional regulator [Sphingomonas formosensis]
MAAEALIDHYARAFLESAEARGLRREQLCPDAALDDKRFGQQELAAISRNAKMLMGDEFGGLTEHVVPIGSLQLMCELTTLSRTLGDALNRAFRFYALLTGDVGFALEVKGAVATISMTVADPCRDPRCVLPEWWLLFWQRYGQWLIGEEIPILSVEFEHEPAVALGDYFEVLGGNIRFGTTAARLCFAAPLLDRRVLREVEDLHRFLAPRPVDLVSVDGVETGLAAALRSRLQGHLQRDRVMPKLEVLARELGICGQTLRRRLEAKGLSYRALKAEVRREVALKCLNDDAMPIHEASLRAGFAEPNGLSRAIRSWVGVSPTDYRAMVAAGQTVPEGSA